MTTDVDIADWPLPSFDDVESKHDRGTVLIIGGSVETPGAVILAGIAALRSGAGRVQIATTRVTAAAVGAAVPEARVIGLDASGCDLVSDSIGSIADELDAVDAVLIGSGGLAPEPMVGIVDAVARRLSATARLVVDAAGLAAVGAVPVLADVRDRTVLIPNPTEAGHVLGRSTEEVDADPVGALTEIVRRSGAAVALRGVETFISAPQTPVLREACGTPALATAGSGDVLAGVVVGLLGSGADRLTALVRAVHAHGVAGRTAECRYGRRGVLARDLLDQIPAALSAQP